MRCRSELRWPHRPSDWELAFRHGEGLVAERDGQVVGTALRWRWGERHATIGLVIVAPACQGRRIGHRLMSALLDGLDRFTVLLHATADGRGLYERLGFVRHRRAAPAPGHCAAFGAGRARSRLAAAAGRQSDLTALAALDARARGMPRDALIADLLAQAEATVVLDRDGASAAASPMLRRFGRGHAIGPVVAPDAGGAKALIAHLSGLNAGRFTRIDIDFDSGLAEWLETLGLQRVDAPTTMLRGPGAGDQRPTRACSPSSRRRWADAADLPVQGRSGARPTMGRSLPARSAGDSTSGSGPTWAIRRGALSCRVGAAERHRPALSQSASCCSRPAPASTSSISSRCRPSCPWCAWWSPASSAAWSSTSCMPCSTCTATCPPTVARSNAANGGHFQSRPPQRAPRRRAGPGLARPGGARATEGLRLRLRRLEPLAPRHRWRALPRR